jgi:hypothetical protein
VKFGFGPWLLLAIAGLFLLGVIPPPDRQIELVGIFLSFLVSSGVSLVYALRLQY